MYAGRLSFDSSNPRRFCPSVVISYIVTMTLNPGIVKERCIGRPCALPKAFSLFTTAYTYVLYTRLPATNVSDARMYETYQAV